MSARPRARWWKMIDWRVVAAAGVPVWAAVIGFVVWDKSRSRPAAPTAVVRPSPVVPPLPLPSPAAVVPAPQEASPGPQVIVVPISVPQPAPAPDARPARELPFWLSEAQTEDSGDEPRRPPDGCETFGTAVNFVKSPTEAMRRAGAEDKLAFVLHLSGNLEDDGFT
jgi:hypothetical protein